MPGFLCAVRPADRPLHPWGGAAQGTVHATVHATVELCSTQCFRDLRGLLAVPISGELGPGWAPSGSAQAAAPGTSCVWQPRVGAVCPVPVSCHLLSEDLVCARPQDVVNDEGSVQQQGERRGGGLTPPRGRGALRGVEKGHRNPFGGGRSAREGVWQPSPVRPQATTPHCPGPVRADVGPARSSYRKSAPLQDSWSPASLRSHVCWAGLGSRPCWVAGCLGAHVPLLWCWGLPETAPHPPSPGWVAEEVGGASQGLGEWGRAGLGTLIPERPPPGSGAHGPMWGRPPCPAAGRPSTPWPSCIGGEVCACSVLGDRRLWVVLASRRFSLPWCSTPE